MLLIPHIPVTVNESSIETDAINVLRVVRPDWMVRKSEIKPKLFTDGLSNKLVGFYIDENPEDVVVVKVYGVNSDLMIDHKAEIETMMKLHERKCGAQLYATFQNGISYEFINGETLNVKSCLCPTVYPLVAKEMAKLHSKFCHRGDVPRQPPKQEVNGKSEENGSHEITSEMWGKMRRFNELAEDIMEKNPNIREKLIELGVTPGFGQTAINELESIIEVHNIPVTFCHNDVMLGNIIFNQKENKVTFIDYEYCMVNYAAFDVANHFLEFAGISDIDYSRCLDLAFQSRWIAEYLKHYNADVEQPISQENFEKWVQLCLPASHLLWGLWGIVQAKHSTIDFDYIAYAALRLSEFSKRIAELRTKKCTGDEGI